MTEDEDKHYTKLVILSMVSGIIFTAIWAHFYFNYSLVIIAFLASHIFAFISSKRIEKHIWAILSWGVIFALVSQSKELGLIGKIIVTIGIGMQVGIVTLFICSEANHRKKKKTEQEDQL